MLWYWGKSVNLYSDAHGKSSDDNLKNLMPLSTFHFSIADKSATFNMLNSPA